MNMEKANVEFRRETTLQMAEHEILLAFNSDNDAELFEAWWNWGNGSKEFMKYKKTWEKEQKF